MSSYIKEINIKEIKESKNYVRTEKPVQTDTQNQNILLTRKQRPNQDQTKQSSDTTNNQTPVKKQKLQPSDKHIELADQLADILRKRKVSVPKKKVLLWADSIRLMETEDEIKLSDINKVLNWYSNNCGGEYDVQVSSGVGLRNKFLQMQIKSNQKPRARNTISHNFTDSGEDWGSSPCVVVDGGRT